MKTILLLGGYGFLGTNILAHIDDLYKNQFRVIVFDKFPRHFSGKTFLCVEKTYSGDFSDSTLIKSIFDDNQIDLVIHSLSTTVPSTSFNAQYDVESNLIPTIELLNQMIQHHVYDIVYLSSGGAIYGNSLLKHKENEDVFPISSYGVVKLSTEKYLMQYAQLYSLRPLILRLSNPYGPYHYSMKQGICNVALATAIQGKEFLVWGDGQAKKDYIYVSDFIDILFQLVLQNVHTMILNIGSGEVVSVNNILVKIKELQPDFKWKYVEASKFDVQYLELDTQKLGSIIGQYKFTSLKDGILKTYKWAKEND